MKFSEVLVAAFFVIAAAQVQGSEVSDARFTSARAYFVGWSSLTRVPLGIDDVIRMRRVYFEINDSSLTANFVDWLRLSEMQKRENARPGDARLVIELTDEGGDVVTLYSDGSHIYSADSSRARPVDEAFRDRFDLARSDLGW